MFSRLLKKFLGETRIFQILLLDLLIVFCVACTGWWEGWGLAHDSPALKIWQIYTTQRWSVHAHPGFLLVNNSARWSLIGWPIIELKVKCRQYPYHAVIIIIMYPNQETFLTSGSILIQDQSQGAWCTLMIEHAWALKWDSNYWYT